MASTTFVNSELESKDAEINDVFIKLITNDTNFWDFKYENTKEYSHGYHSYPAMMIPQVARYLIRTIMEYQKNIKHIFDPFMGSGTTLVEGRLHGLDVTGTDLNPLSRLMSRVKTNPIEPKLLEQQIVILKSNLNEDINKYKKNELSLSKPTFKNIDYWFKPYVIDYLQIIKNNIKRTDNEDLKLFLWVVFSETVRYVSNTRNNEFKLYRMAEEDLLNWEPDVIEVFFKLLSRNEERNLEFYNYDNQINNLINPQVNILNHNSMDLSSIKNNTFDLLVTSPPYGDSKTTVAYGQFSRLSLQWLDFSDINEDEKLETSVNKIDSLLLGGKVSNELNNYLKSNTLYEIIQQISAIDEKRADEVLQFYIDLDSSLKEIARVMKPNSYQCWVVGNRTVRKVNIPTDQIIIELFKKYNIKHIVTFQRNIPNKKMPKVNSPSNKVGEKVTTMNGEIIIIFKKEAE